MSLPEISKRCLACGASVRVVARFCPHCGNNMEAGGAESAGEAGEDLLDLDALKETFAAWESAPPPGEAARPRSSDSDARTHAARDPQTQGPPVPPPSAPAPSSNTPAPPPRAAETTRAAGMSERVETPRAEGVTRRDEAAQTPAAGDGAHAAPQPTANVAPTHAPSNVAPPHAPLNVAPPASPSAASPAGERQRRRAVAAVEERIGPRVEKLREASMGVLEEASEDTGLRFVLVALALFLLAALLIVFNAAVR